jgi:sulfur carrier protein ThiS
LVVEVHLHTILQRQGPHGMIKRLDVTLTPGSTLSDLIKVLEIHPDLETVLLVVNGRIVGANHILVDKDIVHLIPALSGG